MADVIKESLEGYQRRAARADTMDDNEEEDDSAQEAKDYLDVLKDDAEENKGTCLYYCTCTTVLHVSDFINI